MVGNVELFAKFAHGGEVGIGKAHVDRDGDQLEVLRIKAAKLGEGVEQGEGILSGRNADGDSISLLNHLVIVYGATDEAENSFHIVGRLLQTKTFQGGADLARLAELQRDDGTLGVRVLLLRRNASFAQKGG